MTLVRGDESARRELSTDGLWNVSFTLNTYIEEEDGFPSVLQKIVIERNQ